jgi:PhnB protein
MAVKPIPDGYHTVTPSITVNGAAKLIEFIEAAFGAKEAFRMPTPNGDIMHAEVLIGDSVVMLNDAMGQPQNPASLFLYMDDVDAVYQCALKVGAASLSAPTDMFWGDRVARVKDQFGNHWAIATHKEDVPPNELEKRAAAAMKQ